MSRGAPQHLQQIDHSKADWRLDIRRLKFLQAWDAQFGTAVLRKKARQNGENVNPFGAMAFVTGDRSGPWTGWISPAPVYMSGCCLGAVLS